MAFLNGPKAHPATCIVGTMSFLGVNQPGHGADLPLLSNTEVTNGLGGAIPPPPLCVCIGISWGDLYLATLHSKIL